MWVGIAEKIFKFRVQWVIVQQYSKIWREWLETMYKVEDIHRSVAWC